MGQPWSVVTHWIQKEVYSAWVVLADSTARPLCCLFPLLYARFDSSDMNSESIGRGGSTFQPQTAPRRSHGYLASGYETGSSNVCSILHMEY